MEQEDIISNLDANSQELLENRILKRVGLMLIKSTDSGFTLEDVTDESGAKPSYNVDNVIKLCKEGDFIGTLHIIKGRANLPTNKYFEFINMCKKISKKDLVTIRIGVIDDFEHPLDSHEQAICRVTGTGGAYQIKPYGTLDVLKELGYPMVG